MTADVAAIVLAAGKGTRFRSETAKVLHRAAGRSLLTHVLEAVRPLGARTGRGRGGPPGRGGRVEVDACGLAQSSTVLQADQRGTGHAVQTAMPALDPAIRRVLVLPGDTPLLTAGLLEVLLAAGQHSGALLTARMADPTGYGRVVRTKDGAVARIVEHRDADPRSSRSTRSTPACTCVDRVLLEGALDQLDDDNVQGELYLTDVVESSPLTVPRSRPWSRTRTTVAGVNDRSQLAAAARMLRRAHLEHLMARSGSASLTRRPPTSTSTSRSVGTRCCCPARSSSRGPPSANARSSGPTRTSPRCEVGEDAVVHSPGAAMR
jgi:bifunctional UDP-N-acetylglucosamine pyrophosphorylase / glucosamine-1-phosphate N-acetyltransferase